MLLYRSPFSNSIIITQSFNMSACNINLQKLGERNHVLSLGLFFILENKASYISFILTKSTWSHHRDLRNKFSSYARLKIYF